MRNKIDFEREESYGRGDVGTVTADKRKDVRNMEKYNILDLFLIHR